MKLLPIGLYRVNGSSMEPAIAGGSLLVGWRWFTAGYLTPGQVVVVNRPERKYIKRIQEINDQGLWVEGDNARASTDSRDFGYVSLSQVAAVVVMRLK